MAAEGDNAYLYTQNDKYGLFNHSRISVYINEYIDPYEKDGTNQDSQDIWLSLTKALDVWNHFLQAFKVATKSYWVDNINELMVLNYSMQTLVGNIPVRNLPINMPTGISVGDTQTVLSSEAETSIISLLNCNNIELYKTAYLDALNYFQIQNYKQAIVQINIALENYLYLYSLKLLVKNIREDAARIFLEGEISYDEFFLKDYLTEDQFNEATQNGLIKKMPPSTYSIVKKCSAYWGTQLSRHKINATIDKIRKHRNDIVHGIEIKEKLRPICETAISKFEELCEMIRIDAI